MKNLTCRQKIRGTIVVALLAAFVAAIPTGASAAPKLIVQDNSVPAKDKFVVTETGFIGVGTNTPAYPIHIVANGAPSQSQLFFYNGGRATGYTSADAPAINMFRNNDASNNGGLLNLGDRLGYIAFGSVIGGGNKYLANLFAFAEKTWTLTSAPTYITFQTTAENSTGATERLRISSSGNVAIGYSGYTPTQKLEVNGGVRLNTTTGQVACAATNRGTLWYTQGASTGTIGADSLEVCVKDASNNYSWHKIY